MKEKIIELAKHVSIIFLIFFVMWNGIGIIEGIFHKNIIYGKYPEIEITKELNQKLNGIWARFDGNEFLVCLIEEEGIYVDVYEPELSFSNSTKVTQKEFCPANSSIEIHSHPSNVFSLSPYDKDVVYNYTRDNIQPHIRIYGVMFDKSRYALYDSNDTSTPRNIKIVNIASRFSR